MLRPLALSLALLVCVPSVQAQTTWFVDVTATAPGSGTQLDPYTSLQAAIGQGATLPGDTILVAPGVYQELINFSGKSLDVQATGGAGVTTLDGAQLGTVVTVASGEGLGTRLAGFTITAGIGTDLAGVVSGGGLLVSAATLVLEDCVVQLCQAERGAGGYFEGANLTIERSSFTNNSVVGAFLGCGAPQQRQGGGLCLMANTVFAFTELDVIGNSGFDALGAGLSILDSTGTWNTGLVEANRADASNCSVTGGGLFTLGSTIELTQVTFRENLTFAPGTRGGAIGADSGTLTVRECHFEANRAGEELTYIFDFPGFGGAICSRAPAALIVRDSVFIDNLGWAGGGAIEADAADVQDSLFVGNTSQFGGAVCGSGSYVRCQFRDNLATSPSGTEDFGGAVYESGTLDLLQCVLEDNRATGPGGGAHGGTLVECTLRRNSAVTGGGAFGSTLDVCFLRKNDASDFGGALAMGSAVATIMLENTAAQHGGGAAFSTLERCTLFANDASSFQPGNGGAVSASQVTNSILVQNTPDQVALATQVTPYGPSTVEWSDIEGGFAGTGNFDLDPLFWQPLGVDFHLRPGSPCIDAGDPSLMDPDGSVLDLGALPYDPAWCPEAVVFCTAKTNSQGCVPQVGLGASGVLDGVQPFVITAGMVLNQKTGLFFYGLQGRAGIPFFGGTLCAKPPLRRTPLQNSAGNAGPDDCSGTYTFDLATWVASGIDPAIASGSTVVGSFWYRDPVDPNGIGLTNAFEAVVCP